jgi:hypothetical protein
VIWGPLTPYGFIGSHMGPHTAALVEKGARAMSGRTTLSRALESFFLQTKRRSNESPTISTSPSRFSSSGRFSLASAREYEAFSRHQTASATNYNGTHTPLHLTESDGGSERFFNLLDVARFHFLCKRANEVAL